ncbi:MAG: hypothetical protein ACTHJ4_04910, partial [Candidatus Nucleicultricaceae bacterium]
MTSRVFSYLKKATHVVVLASYLFHGVAPAIATKVRFDEDGYTLNVQSVTGKTNGSVWPGVEFTLTQKDGDTVRTLEHRTFSSMAFDEEEQENVSPLKDRKNRSLGFAYDLKGVGRIYVCWEGTLLLHNLHFRGTALNIQTTGAILANNLDGSRLNLEGRAISFAGGNNKISTLSMEFSESLGSRVAHVMQGTILVTHDFSLEGGILQNQGRLNALRSFECHDAHIINDDHITAEKLILKGGTLQNQGILKATVTAEGMDLVDNSGVMEGPWSVACNTFINTGSIKGTGQLKADILENYAFLGDAGSVFNIQKTAHNDGAITARKVTGHGTFTNHNTLETAVLDIPVFLNQQRENVPFKPQVKGESLSITKRVRQFISDKDSTIAVKRLVMEKRDGIERQVQNDGVIEGDQITLQGNVENKGKITTKNFAWQGSTFTTEDLHADHAQLNGKRFQNLGSFEALEGALLLHHLENQGDMILTLTAPSEVSRFTNKGGFTLNGTAKIRTLDNQKTGKIFLKKGSLLTWQLQNQGKMTLDGFVTVLKDGTLQFGEPAFFFDTSWQAPQRIKGPLSQGRHLSVGVLDSLKKIPETDLHIYGKSFNNTSDHVFSYPLHLIIETFKNTKTLKAPTLTVDAKTIDNAGRIEGENLKLHASQNGQNKGRIEASQHLDVVLPQINDWGILVSNGDLHFKTTERDFTWNEGEWLGVGRNLYLTFVGGHLTLNGNHALPGSAVFNAHNFTLQGELETAGDLEVQTQRDIEILAIGQNQVTQPALTDLEMYSLRPDLRRTYPEPYQYMRLRTEPYNEDVLSCMKSGGTLRLQGRNVNNTGGQITSNRLLSIIAREQLQNGTMVSHKVPHSTIINNYGALFYYLVTTHTGNGSFIFSHGPLSLNAGTTLMNNHGVIAALDSSMLKSGLETINRAGSILVAGDADF